MTGSSLLRYGIAALIGAFLGSSLRFLFELFLPDYMARRREVRKHIDRARVPLLQSAIAFNQRIENILRSGYKYGWLEEENYYVISTLYVFCRFLYWLEYFDTIVFSLGFISTRYLRRLLTAINGVSKGLNNLLFFEHFIQLSEVPNGLIIPKYACLAIRDLMTKDMANPSSGCIGFLEFTQRLDADSHFKEWIEYVQKAFLKLKKRREDLRWDRLCIIQFYVWRLIRFLDKRAIYGPPIQFNESLLLNKGVLDKLKHKEKL